MIWDAARLQTSGLRWWPWTKSRWSDEVHIRLKSSKHAGFKHFHINVWRHVTRNLWLIKVNLHSVMTETKWLSSFYNMETNISCLLIHLSGWILTRSSPWLCASCPPFASQLGLRGTETESGGREKKKRKKSGVLLPRASETVWECCCQQCVWLRWIHK